MSSMKSVILFSFLLTTGVNHTDKLIHLFNGKTFSGWEGDTLHTWHINNGAIMGGSLTETVPHNFFLVTRRSYGNFVLRLRFKLVSEEGFKNAGVQFNSQRMTDPPYEMSGYQADLGDGYWASLYDESRRNKTLVAPDSMLIKRILRPEGWNDYEIRTQNGHIRIFLNGHQTVDYKEADKSIPQQGFVGLQIHGGGKTEVSYKDITLTEDAG